MRITFLTPDIFNTQTSPPFSYLASTRWSVIYPARWLRDRGHDTVLMSIMEPYEKIRSEAMRTDRLVLGKLTRVPGERYPFQYQIDIYSKLLSDCRSKGRYATHIVGDDIFDDPRFRSLVDGIESSLLNWFAASDEIAARLNSFSNRPVIVVPECYETSHNPPISPTYGIFRKISRSMGNWGLGLEYFERLRLTWFGHASNISALRDAVADLQEFGKTVPLHLHCVGPAGFGLEDIAAGEEMQRRNGPLRFTFEPWSIAATDWALRWCEAALIPYDLGDSTKLVKSNNRIVAVLRAGRLAIASPIPSAQALARFAWVGEPMSAGLRWALSNRSQALDRIGAGQRYVESRHSPEIVTDYWERVLELEKAH